MHVLGFTRPADKAFLARSEPVPFRQESIPMCGIAGIWNRDGAPVPEPSLRTMAGLLRHRGPDGEGCWTGGDIGLAHRRLKIIDTSEQAGQPMATPDGRLLLVYNGEIHNYLELRRELESRGIVFATNSDTEVALWAYRVWGDDCFERFNGMWAMAFWDSDREELLLSRDRFGIKPLVVSIAGPRVAFASEAKAIIEVYPAERVIDRRELHGFLRGAFPDCGDATFFANIRQLPPGHLLRITRAGERRLRYWRFEPGAESRPPDAEEQFLHLCRDAVRLRLRSDVPLGVLLSGGLDSSAIARLAVDSVAPPLHAFSLRYDDPSVDESGYARMVADAGGAFDVHWIEPPSAPLLETMRAVTWHHDAPCPSRGRYPAWHLMRETGRHVRVALSGDGSDEMLGGYVHFILPAMLDRWRKEGRPLRSVWRELRDLSDIIPGRRLLLRRIFLNPLLRRIGCPAWPTHQILADAFLDGAPRPDPFNQADAWVIPGATRPYHRHLDNALWHEFTRAGLPETMHGQDAASMAFSVENRAPLLDHRIVEFLFRLPGDEKIRDGWTKSLLRRAFKGILPEPVRTRRTKFGFPAPLNTWFKDPSRAGEIRSLLLDGACVSDGIYDRKRLAPRLEKRIRPGTAHNYEMLWRWISTEFWYRDFIRGNPASARPCY